MTGNEWATDACRTCSAPIIWAVTVNAKSMPIDAAPAANANLELTSRGDGLPPLVKVLPQHLAFGRADLRTSHFVTCPQAARWRTRPARRQP